MQIAQAMAGYSLGGADMLRRAMGKKKPEEMAKERVKFMAGAKEQQIDADLAGALLADARRGAALDELVALGGHDRGLLLAHGAAEEIGAA